MSSEKNKNMKNNEKIKIFLFLSLAFVMVVSSILLSNPKRVGAVNSTIPYLQDCFTATATTSVNFMTPGTATTTLDCNVAKATNGASEVWETANLLVQLHSSSSPSTSFKYRFLFSDDNINWFSETATTTDSRGLFNDYLLAPTASSSERSTIGNGTATSSMTSLLIPIPTKARYVRTLFYIPQGSLNGAVWAKVIGVIAKEH